MQDQPVTLLPAHMSLPLLLLLLLMLLMLLLLLIH
jgi:hypothetical protein